MRLRAARHESLPGIRSGSDVRSPHPKGTWDAVEPRNGVPGLIPYHYRKGEQERQEWVLEQVRKAQEIAATKHPESAGRW